VATTTSAAGVGELRDVTPSALASLAILRSRAGRYPVVRDWFEDDARLEVVLTAGSRDDDGVTVAVTTWWTARGAGSSRSETSTVRTDHDGVLVLERQPADQPSSAQARRLALRECYVDGFRSARFVFGAGDIEDDGACEELLLELRADGGLFYADAWGRPGDPFAVRAMTSFAAPGAVPALEPAQDRAFV
jgi:hypothetical protein